MASGVVAGACEYILIFALFLILFLGCAVAIPVSLTYTTNISNCCVGLITILSAEAVIGLFCLVWFCKK